MAKKAKTKKTTATTTEKKKEAAGKPKAADEQQPDLQAEVSAPQAEASIETTEPVAPEPPQSAEPVTEPAESVTEATEPVSAEPAKAEVPAVAPSVAVATRKTAAVPVAVPEAPAEPTAPVASPEPVVAEAPASGILAILKVKSEADAGVSPGTLAAYRAYLEESLDKPIRVCGREPFGWERVYAWGLRDRGAYEARKVKCPSYTDDLEIVGFEEETDTIDGIGVRAKRLSDGKEFALVLASLKSADAGSKNAELLDDFASWLCERH